MVLAYWGSIQPSGLFLTWLPFLPGLYKTMLHTSSGTILNVTCHMASLLIVTPKL